MTRECHVRFCERLRVKLPRPTYQVTAAFIFFVRPTSNVLIEHFHKPADIEESGPPGIDECI